MQHFRERTASALSGMCQYSNLERVTWRLYLLFIISTQIIASRTSESSMPETQKKLRVHLLFEL